PSLLCPTCSSERRSRPGQGGVGPRKWAAARGVAPALVILTTGNKQHLYVGMWK
ncbi:hypothetical protein BaRGS_00023972, partial [Batillaria attramentaria]